MGVIQLSEAKKLPAADIGAWLSIGVYVVLSAVKLAAGYGFESRALQADGFNNTTDILASLAVLIGLRIARKPPDSDHRYGHTRAETVASMVASFIMAAVGLEVLIDGVKKLWNGEATSPDLAAAIVAVIAAAVMLLVYRYNRRLADRTGSHALKAVAADNRSDAFVSLGTVAGILLSVAGLYWLDAVTAIVVAVLICKTAWDIFAEATHMLTDGFDKSDLDRYKVAVSSVKGVERVKDIKGRSHGQLVFVDLTIEVDQQMSVLDSHAIAESIERQLREQYRVDQVHVHIEPH